MSEEVNLGQIRRIKDIKVVVWDRKISKIVCVWDRIIRNISVWDGIIRNNQRVTYIVIMANFTMPYPFTMSFTVSKASLYMYRGV